MGNTGSRLHFLCLSSTQSIEIRLILHLFPSGFVSLPSWKRGNWCIFPPILSNFLPRKVWNLGENDDPLQEYYKIQLFSFLSPASGKTVFSSTWRCVDSSDICWPFHRFVRGVLQRLALRLFSLITQIYLYWRVVAHRVNFFFIFPCNCT